MCSLEVVALECGRWKRRVATHWTIVKKGRCSRLSVVPWRSQRRHLPRCWNLRRVDHPFNRVYRRMVATLGGVLFQASRMAASARAALWPTGMSRSQRSNRRLRNGRTLGMRFLSIMTHSFWTVHFVLCPCLLIVGRNFLRSSRVMFFCHSSSTASDICACIPCLNHGHHGMKVWPSSASH